MNKLRITFSLLTILMFCPMHKGMAQHTEALSDSLVYGIAMYKELKTKYTNKKGLLQNDIIEIVKGIFPNASKVGLNTKLEVLGTDLLTILDLTEALKEKFGIKITEEEAVNFTTVNDIFNAIRPTSDTVMLAMAYYPWRMVFDSRSVHRISLYEDGIDMLTDLTTLTTDSIQRDIYFNELMNIYDVWYEYADTINSQMDIEFSRTLIKSNKARKYDELLPALYRLKWDVGEDTINFKAIQKNVFTPEVDRLYNYMQDALYEQFHKEDVHYETPYKFFRLSHTRLVELNKMGKYKTYAEQYAKDFDSVNVRFEFYKTLSLEEGPKRNINILYNQVSSMYEEASRAMTIVTSKNWREIEAKYREKFYEKVDLWDFGLEEPDAKYLNRIITDIRNDSSEIYVKAMELYIGFKPDSKGMLADIQLYREKLAKIYANEERFLEAAKLYHQFAKDSKDNQTAQALAYVNAAIYYNNAKKHKDAITCCKQAINLEPNFGDAYYYLGFAYSYSHWIKNWDKNNDNRVQDSFIQLLAIDKYELALQKIRAYANDPELGKFNRIDESKISSAIETSKKYSPTEGDVWFFESKFKKGGTLIILNERVKVRFYK